MTVYCPQEFPKLSQSYYALLECLAQDHMPFISHLEPTVFLYIMATISDGLTALGLSLVSLYHFCDLKNEEFS